MKRRFIIFMITIMSQFSYLFCMENTIHSLYQPQSQAIIYAPWREKYINAQQKKRLINTPCTFCSIINNKNNRENLILHRGKYSLIMLASQPYIDNGMHFLIVPYEHKKEVSELSAETYYEENMFTQQLCALFSSDANETYINSNQGSAAGASIPEHHHKHIMINHAPRYYNLIDAMQKTKKYIDLQELYGQLLLQINNLNDIIPTKTQPTPCHQDCYYCSVLQQNPQENFIIHKGKHATIMLSHYPTYFGEIDIIPNEHIESVEAMSPESYDEINQLTTEIYPLMLKIVGAQDSNIGLISYGNKATQKEHIKQRLIPRKDNWKKTPVTKSNHISADIKKFYNKLVSEWHSFFDNNYHQQAAKL